MSAYHDATFSFDGTIERMLVTYLPSNDATSST